MIKQNEHMNRIKKNSTPAAQTEQQQHEANYAQMGAAQKANNTKDLSGLQASLENTINYVAKNHGSQAATAVMAQLKAGLEG